MDRNLASRSVDELAISVATRVVLEELGIESLDQFAVRTANDILEVGSRATLRELRSALASEGLALAGADEALAPRPRPAKGEGAVVQADESLRAVREGHRLTITFLGDPETSVTPADCARAVLLVRREAPTTLVLACDFGSPGQEWVRALGGEPLPFLDAFVFDTDFQRAVFQVGNSIGSLDEVLRLSPNLTRCFATGALASEPLGHQRLRALHVCGDPLSPALADALGRSTLPHLRRLAISVGNEHASDDDLAPFVDAVRRMKAPHLEELHFDVAEGGLAPFVGAKLDAKTRGTLQRVSFGFTSPPDEEALCESLAQLAAASTHPVEVGLPLGATFSRRFARRATRVYPRLQDSASWTWATCLPSSYADW
jgi:hypothetical protein